MVNDIMMLLFLLIFSAFNVVIFKYFSQFLKNFKGSKFGMCEIFRQLHSNSVLFAIFLDLVVYRLLLI